MAGNGLYLNKSFLLKILLNFFFNGTWTSCLTVHQWEAGSPVEGWCGFGVLLSGWDIEG